MNPQDAIDFSREAIMTCMMVGGPILVAGLLIGLLVGVFQAMTQVQDQTVSFVPKILLLLGMISLCLPWLSDKMLGFAKQAFETPITHWQDSNSLTGGESTKTGSESQEAPTQYQPSQPSQSKNLLASFHGPAVTPNPTLSAKTVAAHLQSNDTQLNDAQSNLRLPNTDSLPVLTDERAPENTDAQESTNPFILPHYRFSRAPKTNIDG